MTQTKVCKVCMEEKPISEFAKQKGGRFGVHSYCKKCRKIKFDEAKMTYERKLPAITRRLRIIYGTLIPYPIGASYDL